MWARIVELLLGCWLIISLFLFRSDPRIELLRSHNSVAALLIFCFSLVSFKCSLNKMHLLNILVALWLVVVGYLLQQKLPLILAYQSEIVTGLVLLLFSVVPCHAAEVPRAWQKFYQRKDP